MFDVRTHIFLPTWINNAVENGRNDKICCFTRVSTVPIKTNIDWTGCEFIIDSFVNHYCDSLMIDRQRSLFTENSKKNILKIFSFCVSSWAILRSYATQSLRMNVFKNGVFLEDPVSYSFDFEVNEKNFLFERRKSRRRLQNWKKMKLFPRVFVAIVSLATAACLPLQTVFDKIMSTSDEVDEFDQAMAVMADSIAWMCKWIGSST